MKYEEFNPVLFEEAYDALLERYNEYQEGCPKRRSAASDAQKKAKQAGEAPKKQAPRKKPEVARKPDSKPKRQKSCRAPLPTYSEALESEYDFKTCVYPDGTGYGIADGKKCRKAPEGELKGEDRLASALNKVYESRGAKPSAKDLKETVAAIEKIKKEQGDEALERLADNLVTLIPSSGGRTANTMTVEEVKALQNPGIQKKLNDAFDNDPQSLIGGKNSIIEFKKVSDQDLDNFMSVVPTKIQNTFNGVGKPNNQAWNGTDKEGNAINEGNGSKLRGRELMRLWLSQQGKDAYTGLPMQLDYADLEHIRPLNKTGPSAENPKNWVFTIRSLNQTKGDADMNQWLDRNVNSVKDFKAHQKKFDQAAAGSAGKKQWVERAKSAQIYKELQNNRRLTIEAFESAGALDYLAGAIGREKLNDSDKITFSREVNRIGQRNASKGLLRSKGNFSTGGVSGRMSMAKWITENYPNYSIADKAKIKRIYEDTKNEFRNDKNPYGTTPGSFGKRFAELISEAFS